MHGHLGFFFFTTTKISNKITHFLSLMRVNLLKAASNHGNLFTLEKNKTNKKYI